jgi:hypothetical protein
MRVITNGKVEARYRPVSDPSLQPYLFAQPRVEPGRLFPLYLSVRVVLTFTNVGSLIPIGMVAKLMVVRGSLGDEGE